MSYNVALVETPWGRFLARSALLLGLAGLALMAMFLVVLGLDPSDLTRSWWWQAATRPRTA